MHAVFQRREVALDINVHVGRAGVDNRVALVDRHRFTLEDFVANGGLQNSQVDRLPLAEFIELEFLEPVIEPFQPGKFGIEREPAVIRDLPIVFMQAGGAEKGSRGEVALDEFLRYRLIFRIGCLECDRVGQWQTRRGCDNNAGEKFPQANYHGGATLDDALHVAKNFG